MENSELPVLPNGSVLVLTDAPAVGSFETVRRLRRSSQGGLVQDSLTYVVSKIIPGFFGLISVPVVVRLIGIEEYGRLSVLVAILMALGGAGAGWLQQGILRFTPTDKENGKDALAFHKAVTLGTRVSASAVAVALVPILVVLHCRFWAGVAAEAFCITQLVYLIGLTRLQGELRPRTVARNEAIRSAAGFVLSLILVAATGSRSFLLVLLGLALGYVVPSVFRSHDRLNAAAADASLSGPISPVLKQLWSFGWAVGVWLMLCQALPVIGRTMIQKYSGYADAGTYASMYELAVRSFTLFAFPVTQAAHPRIMRCWNQGEYAEAHRTIRLSIWAQTAIFIPIELVAIGFATPLTNAIVGAHNNAPASLLPLLLLGGFLWQIALLVHKPLEILRRTRTMLAAMMCVFLVEFLGNLLLIPRYGLQAAAYVFTLGALIYLLIATVAGKLPGVAGRVLGRKARPA